MGESPRDRTAGASVRRTLGYLRWRLAGAPPPGSVTYDQWCDTYREVLPPSSGDQLVSVVTPVRDTPVELLQRCLESVAGQTHRRWEHILVDTGSSVPATRVALTRAAERPNVRVVVVRGGISAGCNAGIEASRGEHVAFLDHDDELAPSALSWVASCLPEADVVYSDQDELDSSGRRGQPFFKPAWSPRLLLSLNYVNHLLCVRRGLLEDVGGLRPELDGAQDHDLLLRLAWRADRIAHVPHVLYHWRRWPGSTSVRSDDDVITERALRAIDEDLARRGMDARAERTGDAYRYRVVVPPRPVRSVADVAERPAALTDPVFVGPDSAAERARAVAGWLDDPGVQAVGAGPHAGGISSDALARYPRELSDLGGWLVIPHSALTDGNEDTARRLVATARRGQLLGIPDADHGATVSTDWDGSPHVAFDGGALVLRALPADEDERRDRLRPRWSGRDVRP